MHVKDAKAADGNLTLAAACRKRNAGNNYEIPILDEAKRIKYNEYWQQYRMDQPPAPPAVAETPPAVPTPTAPSTPAALPVEVETPPTLPPAPTPSPPTAPPVAETPPAVPPAAAPCPHRTSTASDRVHDVLNLNKAIALSLQPLPPRPSTPAAAPTPAAPALAPEQVQPREPPPVQSPSVVTAPLVNMTLTATSGGATPTPSTNEDKAVAPAPVAQALAPSVSLTPPAEVAAQAAAPAALRQFRLHPVSQRRQFQHHRLQAQV